MHDAMIRMAGFLARRRRLVVAAWALIVLAALGVEAVRRIIRSYVSDGRAQANGPS